MSETREWRISGPVRVTHRGPIISGFPPAPPERLVDIREYDDRPGSRFVAEMTPEDAERVLADRRRVEVLEAALREVWDCLDHLYTDKTYGVARLAPDLHKYSGPLSIISRVTYAALEDR